MTARFPFARVLLAMIFLCGLVLVARPVVADNPALPELFGAEVPLPQAPASASAAAGPQTVRERGAVLNLAQVEQVRAVLAAGQSPALLGLGLFSDTHMLARFERVDPALGGYSLAGKIDGSPFSEIHLSVSGGAFFASVNSAQGLYQISSPDGKTSRITQFIPASFPREDDVELVQDSAAPAAQPDVTVGPTTVDDGSRVDVYVGYTTAAKNAAGGASAILTKINTAIAETNTGYANSGVNQRVVLVGADEYAYSETNINWSTTLLQWRTPSDPIFGPANTLRETNKADEMVLLVADTGYCGLGYLMTNPSTGFASASFALVSQICATGYYSFAHEMGHNMGAHHDRANASSQGAYPYSYGFWITNPANGLYDWRTIMAYASPAGTGASTRINYWSNPNILYNNLPTGKDVGDVASAYNALTLNNTAPYVAQFRDGAVPLAPTNLTVSAQSASSAQLNWSFSGSDVWWFRIERASAALEDWAQIGVVAFPQLTYTDSAYFSGARYRVLADNGNGRTVSNIAVASFTAPSGLTVTPTAAYQAQLNWTNNSPNAASIAVWRMPASTAIWTNVITLPGGTATTYTDSTVPDGQSYQYQVLASYSGGIYATNAATLIGFPSTPTGFTVVGQGGSNVKLDWTLAAGWQTSLTVERKALAGSFTILNTLSAGALTYTDTTLPASGDYQYRVVAHNTRADIVSSTVTLPAAPTNLHPVYPAAANTINLAWTDNSSAETGFALEISTTGGASWVLESSPAANAQAYGDALGSCSQAPQYRVRAVSGSGQSSAASGSGVTQPCVPVPLAGASRYNAVINWPSVGAGATYNVYLWNGASFVLQNGSPLSALTLGYLKTGLSPNTAYIFRVEAVNAAGSAMSANVPVSTKTYDISSPMFQHQ